MPDYGKRFDTFEMALNQLSEYLYGISIPNLDCISRRCFGYKMGDSVGEWFSPYVETKEAAEYLRDTLKMPFVYREIKTADDVASLLQSSGCVLGYNQNRIFGKRDS